MRDPLATAEFWEQALVHQAEDVAYFEERYPEPGSGTAERRKPASAYHRSLFLSALAKYSAGQPMDEVASTSRHAMIDIFPKLVSDFPPGTPDGEPRPGYDAVHRWIAMTALSGATLPQQKATFEALGRFDLSLDGHDGSDLIWTRYRNALTGADDPVPEFVHWPQAYKPLAQALHPDEPDFARPHYLKKFVEGWYECMSAEIAAQTTWGDDLGPESRYVGYWCIEAAAASVVFGIPDTEFSDHRHYPKAWADWARAQRG